MRPRNKEAHPGSGRRSTHAVQKVLGQWIQCDGSGSTPTWSIFSCAIWSVVSAPLQPFLSISGCGGRRAPSRASRWARACRTLRALPDFRNRACRMQCAGSSSGSLSARRGPARRLRLPISFTSRGGAETVVTTRRWGSSHVRRSAPRVKPRRFLFAIASFIWHPDIGLRSQPSGELQRHAAGLMQQEPIAAPREEGARRSP